VDECSRRRVRRPSIATYLSSIGVFHWQHLGRTAGCEVPRGLPPLEIAYEGDGQALCSQGNGVQRSRCGRLPNLQRAQRNLMFATIEEARTSMFLSEVPRPVSCKGRISIRSKSKPSLGTIRRNEKGDVLRAGTKWLGARGQGPPVREMVISCKLLQTLEEDSCDVPQKGRSSHGCIVRFW